MQEIVLALRRLRRDPWAVAGAVLAAALGAGLNTAVFAVAYGVLGRPLPYADAERLVLLSISVPQSRINDWRASLPSLASMTAFARENLTVEGAGDARLATVALVDDHFFETVGTRPRSGRTFTTGDSGLAVMSERFARQSGLDVNRAPGSAITVGGVSLTVAGIVGEEFAFPSDRIDLWVPAATAQAVVFNDSGDVRRFSLVGKLKPGVPPAQAAADATRARVEINPDDRRAVATDPIKVERLRDVIVGGIGPVLRAFSAAAWIVLLVACANIATILIGRTLSRERELAVRRALGATRGRLFAGVVSESLIIALAGAAGGVLLAFATVRLISRWAAGIIPRLAEIQIDWTVLLFATGVAALAATLAALPALRTLGWAAANLRVNTIGPRRGDRRIRGALIVTQIALAVVLLAGGGLLARTILSLLRSDIGVETRGTIVTQLLLTEGMAFNASPRGLLLDDLLRRVRALPQVRAAGAGSTLPPDNAAFEVTFRFVRDSSDSVYRFSLSSVTPGYLPAIGARILQGRDVADGDERGDRPMVVLSQTAARAFGFSGDAVGRELSSTLPGPLRARGRPRVIGVVSDIKYTGLAAETGPAIYLPWRELPAGHLFLAIRSDRDSAAFAPAVRSIVRSLDARIPAMPIKTLDDVVQRSVSDRRLNAMLGASVSLLAFAVAMVGLSASLMRVVSERRQELAIRAALGATPARAVQGIVGEGAVLAGAGVVLGSAGAVVVGRGLGALLHGVSPHDPVTIAGVAVFVGAASLVACYMPARRAARIDPLVLLRSE